MATATRGTPGRHGSGDRFGFALEVLALRPGHRVLEVGCGHGVAVTAMATALGGDGHVHAVDRSAEMIAAAARRNASLVASGLVSFQTSAVQDAVLEDDSFDRVVALRVRELWTDAAAVLPRLRRCLRRSGRLCLVIDAPRPGGTTAAVRAAREALDAHGFDVTVRDAPAGLAAVLGGRRVD